MKLALRARRTRSLQHAAHLVALVRCSAFSCGSGGRSGPPLARGARHRVLPDDGQLRRNHDGACRRRRGTNIGARVHDAVLDAADGVARAARARARHAMGCGRRGLGRARARRRAMVLAGRSGAEALGRAVRFRLGGGTVGDQVFPAPSHIGHAQFHRLADARRRPAVRGAAARARASAAPSGAHALLRSCAIRVPSRPALGFLLWLRVLR